jgi:hypothetical protein
VLIDLDASHADASEPTAEPVVLAMLDNTEERWTLDDQVQPNRYCSRVSPVLARRSAAMVGASRSARRFAVSCPHCLRAGVFCGMTSCVCVFRLSTR